jgi:hypothetical protein
VPKSGFPICQTEKTVCVFAAISLRNRKLVRISGKMWVVSHRLQKNNVHFPLFAFVQFNLKVSSLPPDTLICEAIVFVGDFVAFEICFCCFLQVVPRVHLYFSYPELKILTRV